MHGVAQLDTADLPLVTPWLEGIEVLTLFIADDLPVGSPNGRGWCLRTYPRRADLVALPRPTWPRDPRLPKDSDPALKPFPLRFETIDDIPSRDDVPVSLLDAWDDLAEADPQFGAAMGLKLGGWPYCIQSEIAWVEDGRRVG
jgi:hypothetical protein